MSGYTVLICDDNRIVHSNLKAYLNREGIRTVSAFCGEDAIRLAEEEHVDLIVLDVMLPDISGIKVCRTILKSQAIPIIMLSARTEEFDRILGLEAGAVDYVQKPFSGRELVIKITNVLNQFYHTGKVQKISFQGITVIPTSMEVYINNEKIDLSPKENKILIYMVQNANTVLSRDQLLNAVWGFDYTGDTRVVDALITRMRKKLPCREGGFSITSIYGVGYKLEARPYSGGSPDNL